MNNLINKIENNYNNVLKNNISFFSENNFDLLKNIKFEEDYSRSYLRNKIFENEKYELILIKWKPNSESLIHDHASNGCLLKVIEGSLKETLYDQQINKKKETIFNKEEVNYIDNKMGYHKITNLNNDYSYSLHLYSPPNHEIKILKNNIL